MDATTMQSQPAHIAVALVEQRALVRGRQSNTNRMVLQPCPNNWRYIQVLRPPPRWPRRIEPSAVSWSTHPNKTASSCGTAVVVETASSCICMKQQFLLSHQPV